MICDHEPNPAYGVLDYRKYGVPGVWLVCKKCERVYPAPDKAQKGGR